MVRKIRLVLLDPEAQDTRRVTYIQDKIGQVVPLSHYYLKGQKPTLIGVEGELCLLRYPDGATMRDVPIEDLVDDTGIWKGASLQ